MTDFDNIRSFRDDEVPHAIREFIKDPAYPQLAGSVFPDKSLDAITNELLSIKSIHEFQEKFSYQIVHRVVDPTVKDIKIHGVENIDKQTPYLLISNHRDIVLDAAILNVVILDAGIPMTEIAIGTSCRF